MGKLAPTEFNAWLGLDKIVGREGGAIPRKYRSNSRCHGTQVVRLFTLAVAELGPLTGTASGVLNMAIVGGAVIPVIQGVIADRIGVHHAFVFSVICYLYILFYALSGSKPNSERYLTTSK